MILHLTQKKIPGRCALFRSLKHSVYCVYIPKFHFKLYLEPKKILMFFFNLEYMKFIKYHLSVKLSWRRDTLYDSMIRKYHTDSILSHLRDSITKMWFAHNWLSGQTQNIKSCHWFFFKKSLTIQNMVLWFANHCNKSLSFQNNNSTFNPSSSLNSFQAEA